MVAYAFNSQQHTPQYGGGGGGLPAGPNGENVKYKVIIANSAPVDTKDAFGNPKGGYLAFELACIEGPQNGVKQTDRLNLHHTNPQVVQIANQQLSAYCHVLGKFAFQDTQELHGIPFIVEIGLQKGEEARAKGYTEVKALFDINGNEPGKAGAGQQVNQQQNVNIPNQPAAGVQAQGGGWGGNQGGGSPGVDNNVPIPGANQGQGGGQPQWGQQGQQQPDPNANQGGQGGWGGQQPAQGQQPQQGGWGQQNGAQGGGQGGQPQWGQQAGGAPGWGQGQ